MKDAISKAFVAGIKEGIKTYAWVEPVKNGDTYVGERGRGVTLVQALADADALAGQGVTPTGRPVEELGSLAASELRELHVQVVKTLEAADYFETRGRGREGDGDKWRVDQEELAMAKVPEHLREGLAAYLDEHRKPGHFLLAVLSNDLRDALGRADTGSRAGLFDLVSYLHNFAPAPAWGSPEMVRRWLTPWIPELVNPLLGRPILDELSDGKAICPNCQQWHQVHTTTAEPGKIELPEDKHMKTKHDVQFVWCHRNVLAVVAIEGKLLL